MSCSTINPSEEKFGVTSSNNDFYFSWCDVPTRIFVSNKRDHFFKGFVAQTAVGRKQPQGKCSIVNFAKDFVIGAIHVRFTTSQCDQLRDQVDQFTLH